MKYFKPHLYSLVFCFLISSITFANNDKSLQDVKLLSRFPFILLDGGMIILKANINNLPDTLNFVLDTGCSGISLDSSTAARLKLFAKISDHNIIGISQFKKASFITNQTLRLPNFAVDSLNFHINDYTFLSNANDIQIDGIIGYSFLKRFIVKINYDSLQMEVWKPGKMKYPKDGFLMYPQLDGLAMCEAGVKDNRTINQNYVFDTGAEVCLLLSENFVLDSNVLTVTKKRIEVPAEGSGGKKLMKFTTVDELQLGPYKFKKVPTYIFKDDNNVMRYPGSGGLIGNDLLYRFNLVLNYPEANIHLTPNSHFNEPFDYTYIGFKLYEDSGRITIDNIAENSPAEKSGLQNGDEVLGVNNNFSNNIDSYKKTISRVNSKVKMSILRKNQIKTVVVLVESVL